MNYLSSVMLGKPWDTQVSLTASLQQSNWTSGLPPIWALTYDTSQA
jgi:hypothetical protein